MNLLLLTNESGVLPLSGGGQKLQMMLNALRKSLNDDDQLRTLRIPHTAFFTRRFGRRKSLPFAGDIEFSIALDSAISRKLAKTNDVLSHIEWADVVILDSCYLWPAVSTFLTENIAKPIVLITHNYESDLKTEIAELVQWPSSKKIRYLNFIKEIERDALENADLVIATSPDDYTKMKPLSSGVTELILTGAHERSHSDRSREQVLQFVECEGYVLFVSSAHPPNIQGFRTLLGSDLSFLPPSTKIVIAGNVAGNLLPSRRSPRENLLDLSKVSLLSTVSDDVLNSLYDHASAIVLPVLSGGGMSIKALEALMSGRPVIATSFALRGIDYSAESLKGLVVADNSCDFRAAVFKALEGPFPLSLDRHSLHRHSWQEIEIRARDVFCRYFANDAQLLRN